MKQKNNLSFRVSIGIRLLMLLLPLSLSAAATGTLPESVETEDEWTTDSLTVDGIVTDLNGETIIGATVIEKGRPENGVVTDIDGKFLLKVPPRASW